MGSKLGATITAGSVIVPMVASWMIFSMILETLLRSTQVMSTSISVNLLLKTNLRTTKTTTNYNNNDDHDIHNYYNNNSYNNHNDFSTSCSAY